MIQKGDAGVGGVLGVEFAMGNGLDADIRPGAAEAGAAGERLLRHDRKPRQARGGRVGQQQGSQAERGGCCHGPC